MILHIVEAEVAGPHLLRLKFNDGAHKTVDVRPLLEGPVFESLKNPDYFALVTIDPVCGTVAWPNGADFAPEALHELALSIHPTSRTFPERGEPTPAT